MSTPRILGLPFRSEVKKQIDVRQAKLANVNRWGMMVSGSRVGQPDELVVFESATSFVRLSSAVSIDGPERLKSLETNLGIGQGNISGYNLAKNLVLWGGVNIQNTSSMLGAQPSIYYGLNSSYGFLSDGSQGLKPMPGITSMTTTYKNNGSLKEATVQIKCFTRKQFEAIEAVYLRLGYTMVLEWGHTDYFKNDENKESIITNPIIDKLFPFPDQNITAEDIQLQIEKNKQNTSYNYDGLLARVTNFNWTLNSDLSYDITLYLISWGDIIDSLKINTNNNSSQVSSLKFTTNNSLPPSSPFSDPPSIPQNLVNILNNKSLSTLNSLFFDIYSILILQNLDSFPKETRGIIEDLKNQEIQLKYIPIVNKQALDWINKYEQFKNEYNPERNLTESDQKNMNEFIRVLTEIKIEIGSINNATTFKDYWGKEALAAYGDLTESTKKRLSRDIKYIPLLDYLKGKIKDKYDSALLSDTDFEVYLNEKIEQIYQIDL